MNQHTTRGFTLIESIVVITISTVAMLAVMSSVLYFYRTNANAIEQAFALSSARKGVEYLVRDIREATYSEEGSFPVIAMNQNEFYFYSDTDKDSAVERIRYYLEGIVLKREVTEPTGSPLTYSSANAVTSVVSEDVRNAEEGTTIFRYYDKSGVEITDYGDITDVVLVDVTLIININPVRLPEEFTLRSTAALRNLRTN